jgi:hypothetical protein
VLLLVFTHVRENEIPVNFKEWMMFCSWIEKKRVQQLILDMKRATDSEVRVQKHQARVVIAEHETAQTSLLQRVLVCAKLLS